MKKINILVCGAGGDIGQSLFKCLKNITWISDIIGTDVNLNTPSKFLYDKFFKVERCTNKKYLKKLHEITLSEKINLIIPASEEEIRFFHTKGILVINKTKIVSPNYQSLEIGLNKFKTFKFLNQNGIPYPKTESIDFDLKKPLIAKARESSGGKNIYKIENEIDYEYVKRKHPDYVFQEFVGGDKNEFTCGLFRSKKGEIRTIIINRELSDGGYTNFGEVVSNSSIREVLFNIAERINLKGSINVQLRKDKTSPKVIEINSRFSSTVFFRHLLGFQDVMWALEDILNLPLSRYEEVKSGKKFYKGFKEFL